MKSVAQTTQRCDIEAPEGGRRSVRNIILPMNVHTFIVILTNHHYCPCWFGLVSISSHNMLIIFLLLLCNN